MLTPQQQGTLLITELDRLPTMTDILDPGMETDGCCPQCCGSCGVLRDLLRAGTLEETIQQAPAVLYDDSDWWREGRVDRLWLNAVWGCQNQPPCETAGLATCPVEHADPQ